MRVGVPFKPGESPIGIRISRGWLALISGFAVSLGAIWVVWRLWGWGFGRWFAGAPGWLAEPDFVWFAVAWFTPSLLLLMALRRRI